MTRLIFGGGELALDYLEVLTAGGSAPGTYDTAAKRSGSYAIKFDTTAGNATGYRQRLVTLSTGVRYFGSLWFYVPSATGLPTTNTDLLAFFNAGTQMCAARLTTAGKIRLQNQAGTQIGSDSSATVTTNTWHHLDLGMEIGTGAVDYCEARLDGVSVASSTTQSLSDVAGTLMRFGFVTSGPGITKVIYIDDYALNDNTGSAHTSWVGDDKMVLLLPTADAARDAGWIGGAGGTTNLYDALNNLPPVGVATASATDTSQIENAVSTTTEEYDATMTTYTAAGIGAGDTITAILGMAVGGSSSTTGSDTLGVSVESNPVIAEASPSIDSITVTFPTGWNRCYMAIEENPSVTKGTAPVMSVRKQVATTRIHQVCFMGMYVSYTVGVAPSGTRHRSIMMVG